MAMEKWVRQLNNKLDAIAENLGIDTEADAWGADAPPPTVEAELEAETGHDMIQTGDNPVTYAESEEAAPAVPKRSVRRPEG